MKKIIAALVLGVALTSCSTTTTSHFSSPTTTTTISFPVPEGLPTMTCDQLNQANHATAQKLSDYLDTIYRSSWDKAEVQSRLKSDPEIQEARQVMTVINAYIDSCKGN